MLSQWWSRRLSILNLASCLHKTYERDSGCDCKVITCACICERTNNPFQIKRVEVNEASSTPCSNYDHCHELDDSVIFKYRSQYFRVPAILVSLWCSRYHEFTVSLTLAGLSYYSLIANHKQTRCSLDLAIFLSRTPEINQVVLTVVAFSRMLLQVLLKGHLKVNNFHFHSNFLFPCSYF